MGQLTWKWNHDRGFADNVSTAIVDQRLGIAVPEPTSLALLGIGAIGLLGRRRR